ncbi:HNH endonuclease signature motif containing protein [Cellulomonas denverensis]|uniref:DUF222 domain-containing protein n=1 Tax=Cellulomonas denverensis TaxID=264297 RepID=A0A7X6KXZ6_9CELL|nr:HNH endonuclease signature motif containing protein [Cellulomonas denverensis]NKY24246.1 DUF222 domain-containing protein [Cellulomonas denverensis]
MALDLREYDPGELPVRSGARVFTDPWDVGGDLWWLEGEDPLDPVEDAPPRWVTDPVLAARVAAEQTAADPTLDPRAQVEEMLAENGPVLARMLANLDPVAVDLLDLPAVAEAAARLESWAHAVSARVAAELAERDEMNPVWPEYAGNVHQPNTAADELAIYLNIGRRSAQTLVDEGLAYERHLPGTGQALRTGRIDTARARVMVRRLAGVDLFTAEEVETTVLPGASERTAAQLSRDVDRALLRVDPDGGALRRRRGRADRHVARPKPLGDGMAGVWAFLPAHDAARLDQALDASAHALRSGGDERTLAQLRADALLDAALVGPAWAPLLPEHGAGTGQGAGTHHGAMTFPGAYTGERAGTHERTGTEPGVDTGYGADMDCLSGKDGGADSGHRAATGHRAPSVTRPRVEVRVTVPLSTLIGTDQEPAEMDGHGPIDAATARALAAGGVWRRLVTDPLSGAVLDVGRTRYRPPQELADHVIARDRTCARPGCTVPATACDLDHTIPFGDGGPTAATNLAPLCRRDHLLRTHAGHRIEQTAAGEIVWTSLTRRYVSVPGRDGEHRMLRERPGEPPGTYPGDHARPHTPADRPALPTTATDQRALLTAGTRLPAPPGADADDEVIPF